MSGNITKAVKTYLGNNNVCRHEAVTPLQRGTVLKEVATALQLIIKFKRQNTRPLISTKCNLFIPVNQYPYQIILKYAQKLLTQVRASVKITK
jgi:hypothetical protein